uniref:Uncharacterized protein n=1 Tax=Arundo donax TaxID=35708 RepID=A0A0A9AFD1_ARUDO
MQPMPPQIVAPQRPAHSQHFPLPIPAVAHHW